MDRPEFALAVENHQLSTGRIPGRYLYGSGNVYLSDERD